MLDRACEPCGYLNDPRPATRSRGMDNAPVCDFHAIHSWQLFYPDPYANELDATILWVSGYYDGPLDGMCLVGNTLHWFKVDPETQDKYYVEEDEWLPRRYFIYELTDREARNLCTRHFLFELYVGNSRGCRHLDAPVALKPRESMHRFYDLEREPDPTEGKTPIGVMKNGNN